MTVGVIGSSFFFNVSNCWLNSYGKFGGASRRRFFAICEKPEGGGVISAPPGRAQVKKINHNKSTSVCVSPQFQSNGKTRGRRRRTAGEAVLSPPGGSREQPAVRDERGERRASNVTENAWSDVPRADSQSSSSCGKWMLVRIQMATWESSPNQFISHRAVIATSFHFLINLVRTFEWKD